MVYQILGTLKKQPWKHMKQIFLNVPWVVLFKSPELSEPVELKGAMEIQWQDSDGLVYFRGPFDGVSRY